MALSKPEHNNLLAALPEPIRERLFPHLELVEMPLGEVLYESGSQLHYVYFPTTSIVSLLYVMEDGASAEMRWWARKAYSAFPCSWAAKPPRAAP